jgi:hypothetical protein
MQLVKITNISHESSQGATSAWIASRNLSPGMSITVPVAQLPPEWERLGTIFKFEFMGAAETGQPELPPASTQPPTELAFSLEMLEALMDKVVSKHMAMATDSISLAVAGQGNGITKDELIDTLKQHVPTVINGREIIAAPHQAIHGGPSGVFIPKIEEVEESSISIQSSTEKVDSKSLKERLRKNLSKPS